MAVDIDSLSPTELVMLLSYQGDPPDDPAFDKVRVSPAEWRTLFPAATSGGESHDANPSTTDSPAATPAADGPGAPEG